MADLSKQRLIELADEKLSDAKLLLASDRPANAYYLAGYAVELMLKAALSSRFQAHVLADPSWSKEVFTHDLGKLAKLALLDDGLKTNLDDPAFRASWEFVLEWSEKSRYEPRERHDAERLIQAIDHPHHGVLQWLRARL